jgi:hypothetical protein
MHIGGEAVGASRVLVEAATCVKHIAPRSGAATPVRQRGTVTCMVTILGLILVLILAGPGLAQTYSRCVDAAGGIYLTEDLPPAGIRCVAQATRELKDTLHPAEKPGAPTAGHQALWLTAESGVILLTTYQSEGACRAARDARMSAAGQRAQLDVAYRCLPAGTTP